MHGGYAHEKALNTLVMRKMQIKATIKAATQPLEWLNNPGCW